ncbi:hypothetical protein FHETE_5342 [Fusarium heterosporum]|uniref:Uncharacterized protein n=1 Tax=Fusarium heterosporum TaxID=42747 RepID=A0A8H5TE61_FUSHE|nr:hypothetical protein FHETE_5342 [Fusarium heterosporum]
MVRGRNDRNIRQGNSRGYGNNSPQPSVLTTIHHLRTEGYDVSDLMRQHEEKHRSFNTIIDGLRNEGYDVTDLVQQHNAKHPCCGVVSGPCGHDGSPSGGGPALGQLEVGGSFAPDSGQTRNTATDIPGIDQANTGGVVPGFGQTGNTAEPGERLPVRQTPSFGSGKGGITAHHRQDNKGHRGNKHYGGVSNPKPKASALSKHIQDYQGFLESQVAPTMAPESAPWGITWATGARMVEYVDERGQTATDIVNTSVYGGDQSRFACKADGNVIMGKARLPIDASELAQDVLKSTPCSEYIITIQPVQPERLESIKSKATMTRTVTHDRSGPDGKPLFTPGYVPVKRIDKCASCGSTTHLLATCLRAVRGFIAGCPICNSQTHSVDDCRGFKEMSLAEKVQLLVTKRGNMPAIWSKAKWYMLLHEYCGTAEFKDAEDITAFPWSTAFTKRFVSKDGGKSLAEGQKKFDAGEQTNGTMEVDPATSSYEAIFELYWKKNHIWPPNLGHLDAAIAAALAKPEAPYDNSNVNVMGSSDHTPGLMNKSLVKSVRYTIPITPQKAIQPEDSPKTLEV